MTHIPIRAIDQDIWEGELAGFVPMRFHDAHVHLYRTAFDQASTPEGRQWSQSVAQRGLADVSMAIWQGWNAALFPGRVVHGTCMGFPFVHADIERMNEYVVEESRKDAGSVPAMIVKPGMDPLAVDTFIERHGVVGIKPYRVYASSGDAVECSITDFLPEELIEVANGRGLIIVLHMSKSLAVADPQNMADLTRFNRQYPRVQWQLAHCARCFIPGFLEQAIDQLAELENIWFDTSAVCESDVFNVLFRRGPRRRILFGTDNLPAGADRGKYIAFGHAWALLTEDNHQFNLSHCNSNPTWVVYEGLRALRRTADQLQLSEREVEALFYTNAMDLLARVGRIGNAERFDSSQTHL